MSVAVVDGAIAAVGLLLEYHLRVSQAGRTMQADRRPLFDRLAVFPRLGLADLPTPLEPMKRLTAHLGGPRLWVSAKMRPGLASAATSCASSTTSCTRHFRAAPIRSSQAASCNRTASGR